MKWKWNVEQSVTDGSFETFHGGADGSLQLDDIDAVVQRLRIDDDLHVERLVLDDSLDRTQLHPQIVGVEELERLDRFEIFHLLFRHLGNFQQTQLVLVLNQRTTLS